MEYKIIPNKKDSFSDRIKNAIENIENELIECEKQENDFYLIQLVELETNYIKG